MATGALSQAGVMASRVWLWWWEVSNRRDELARAAFALLLITAAALSSFLTWRRKKTNPSLPPGPTGLPLLGSLPFLGSDPLHRRFADLAGTYGPVMSLRLGTKLYVVVSSPAAAKEVLRDYDAVFANRDVAAVMTVLSYGGREIAWNNDPASWRLLRKMCVRELLNSNSLDAFYALRRGEVRAAVREVYGRRGTPVGVGEVSFLTLLDVMTNVLWGGTMEGAERSSANVKEEFRGAVQGIMEVSGVPNVSDLVPALAPFDLQGLERRMKKLVGWWDVILNRIIDARLRADGADGRSGIASRDNKDFLDVMLDEVKKSGTETPLTMDHVKATLLEMVVGGTETSSTTVEWALAEMIHNRDTLRRAQEELDAVVGGHAVVEESHLPKLRYLDAVVKETLRLHPVVPLLVPRRPREPCVVGGHRVPAGATVFVNTWMIHREPSSWEDAPEFKPERFLRGDTRWDYRGGGDFRFLPFGSGRRICAGMAMGERMTMFLLANFLHSFEWRLPAGAEVDFTEAVGFTNKMARPLYAMPTPRLSDPGLYE